MKILVRPQRIRSRKLSQLWCFIAPIAFCAVLVMATIAFAWPGQAQNTTPPAAQSQGSAPGYGGAARGGASRGMQPDPEHPVLPIGSPFPDFSLPGVDGKTHTLSEYSGAKILAVVFESNHCPVSIAYETRIKQLYEDYKNKGMVLIAINPNNPTSVQLSELGYTDM